jgi:HEAT repeat protein
MIDAQKKALTTPAFLLRALETLGSVRPAERRDTLGAFVTLLGFMAGHALLETARDALFLAELPASLLPWVYLTLAASTLLLMRYQRQLARYFRAGQELNGWLLFAGLSTIALWLAIYISGDWIFYVLYAWTGILATLVVVQFWTMLSNRFTVTQAKRLFAIIGTGSVIGAIIGSGAARALTEILPAHHLVLAAGAVFLVSSLGPRLLAPQPIEAKLPASTYTTAEFKHVSAMVWSRPYLRRVAIAILLATVTFTLVDFVFKSTVARVVADDQLGEFFASVYFSLNIVSLFVQVAVVSWILRHVTVSTALAIVPALLLLGALGFIATAGLAAALILKGADGSLRYSMYRTTTELLFVPMSAEIRGPVKTFIDVLGQRGGQAAGSLLVLITLSLTTNEVVVAILAAICAGAWLYLVFKLKPHYLELFRQTLKENITATKIDFPALDVASLETLLATLNSSDDRKVIAALDLLAAQYKMRVVPGLILYHPSPLVVRHALELFVADGREDAIPVIDRLLSDQDESVRTASLRARTTLMPNEALLRNATTDPSAMVRVTAAVGLVAGGWMPYSELAPAFHEILDQDDQATLVALAKAIRALPSPDFKLLLRRLAAADDTEVQLAAIGAMRALGDPEFTAILLELLARRALRSAARDALVALGPAALAALGTALADTKLPHALRRHVPQVIAACGTPQASALLMRHLLGEADGMIRFKILRALGRMRAVNDKLPLDHLGLGRSIEQNIESAFRFMRWKRACSAETVRVPAHVEPYHRMLVELLADKQAHTLERLFRLLNLQANDEEFLRVYRGFQSAKREARAGSRELVEYLVQPHIRRAILTLADDLDDPSAAVGSDENGRIPTFEQAIRELLESGIESLSSLAAYMAGMLGWDQLRPALERIDAQSESQSAIVQAAIAALSAAHPREMPRG